MTVHEGRKSHECKICRKSFGEGGTLKMHIKTVHEGEKLHQCDMCGKREIH